MADSLTFDGVDDYIQFSAGAIDGTGALTVVAIVKMTANATSFRELLGWNSMDAVWGVNNQNPASPIWFPEDGPYTYDFTWTAEENWVLLGLSKIDGGPVQPRLHKYVYDTDTWTHTQPGNDISVELPACTSVKIGATGTPGNFMNASFLIMGWWDSVLADGDIETLIPGTDAWVDLSPAEAWRFNTMSAIDSLTGTSTETTRVGTSLNSGDAPAGWDDGGVAQNQIAWIRA